MNPRLPTLLGKVERGELPPHAKIVATLGPASQAPEMVRKLIEAGVGVFRLNFSHGGLEDQLTRLQTVRRVAGALGRQICVLGDLQGPKMRVGPVPNLCEGGGIVIDAGDDVLFRVDHEEAEMNGSGDDVSAVLGTTFNAIFTDVEPGQRVLINDGAIRMLAVERRQGEWLRCRVTVGGRITSHKGINLPESDLRVPAITDRDWTCVEWGVRHGVDAFALSFVRTPDEVLELKSRLEGMVSVEREFGSDPLANMFPVIAKIEKPQAIERLDEIIEAADGVMVARGDLGVEMETQQVPVAQKYILERAKKHGKPVIVATQMLETMIENPIPTRAEASDVANAIFDGADAVMLSGETAVGKHPALVVETMRRIIEAAEAWIGQTPHTPSEADLPEYPFRSAALALGAWHVVDKAGVKLVAVWSESGGMARYLSQTGLRVPILAFSSSGAACRRMNIMGGVIPVHTDPPETGTLHDWTDHVERLVLERRYARSGDAVVLIAGKPLGSVLGQDAMAILRLGDPGSGFRSQDGD
ncbi:MAG: pyruvate kinase [Phycisphaeraceae bacterium]|nr:MAG: pyruvate kinase [Phycisphaeraceae bacterium]